MMHIITPFIQFMQAPDMKYVELEPGGLTERYSSRLIKTSNTFLMYLV